MMSGHAMWKKKKEEKEWTAAFFLLLVTLIATTAKAEPMAMDQDNGKRER